MNSRSKGIGFIFGLILVCSAAVLSANSPRTQAQEIRHQVVMSPYYGVFDWIEAVAQPDHTVVLRGQVREPYGKSDVGSRILKVEGVAKIDNQIEVLPVSQRDDDIRLQMYRAIFRYNSPLFRYADPINPAIHIIVNNGRVTLKGVVADRMDSQLAYVAARSVAGVFEVNNDLVIAKS